MDLTRLLSDAVPPIDLKKITTFASAIDAFDKQAGPVGSQKSENMSRSNITVCLSVELDTQKLEPSHVPPTTTMITGGGRKEIGLRQVPCLALAANIACV